MANVRKISAFRLNTTEILKPFARELAKSTRKRRDGHIVYTHSSVVYRIRCSNGVFFSNEIDYDRHAQRSDITHKVAHHFQYSTQQELFPIRFTITFPHGHFGRRAVHFLYKYISDILLK